MRWSLWRWRCGHCAAGTQTFSAQRVPLAAGGGRGGGGGGRDATLKHNCGWSVISNTVVVFSTQGATAIDPWVPPPPT
eukprot:scaffold57210_cov56-Phaeocystis_antarctica.AAC.2